VAIAIATARLVTLDRLRTYSGPREDRADDENSESGSLDADLLGTMSRDHDDATSGSTGRAVMTDVQPSASTVWRPAFISSDDPSVRTTRCSLPDPGQSWYRRAELAPKKAEDAPPFRRSTDPDSVGPRETPLIVPLHYFQRRPGPCLHERERRAARVSTRSILSLLVISVLGTVHPAYGALRADERARMRGDDRLGRTVADSLESNDRVRVIVMFALPATASAPSPDLHARRTAVHSTRDSMLSALAAGEFSVRRTFQTVEGVAGEVTPSGVLHLLDLPVVRRIDVDEGGSGDLTEAVPLVNLDLVHALGFTGAGVTVAVIDSGIDTNHPDLSDSLVAEQCFCSGSGGCCPNGSATQSGAGAAEDDNGHGTNVAGIITSNGTVAPAGGAPGADIVAVKVLDSNNSFCCTSDVVAALDWIANNQPAVRVVNMSLGTFFLYPNACDPVDATTNALASAVNTLNANGVTVFASSGNQASGTRMAAPACIAHTISVGAVWDSNAGGPYNFASCTDTTTSTDQVTCFSNSDAATDLFAPGAPTTSTGIGGGTSTYFGTSQASPLCAACAATLLQADPGMTPADVETALKSSPTHVTDAKNGLSFPRLDCAAAFGITPTPTTTPTPTSTPTPTCGDMPVASCRTPAAPAKAQLSFTDNANDAKDKLAWKWLKGSATTGPDFGDPLSTTEYQLCVYDGTSSLIAHALVPAGGLCNVASPRPCWTVKKTGFKYKDKDALSEGIQQIVLKSGVAEAAKIVVKGKGAALAMPPLFPLAQPLTVQLRNTDGVCWEATYSAPATKNIAGPPARFKDKAD
jgi:hypothetical protein